MKVVVLCGGLGTRLSEETTLKPKPMVTIGGHPILWHILKIFSQQGFNQFTLALGYKGEAIKDYFLNYYALNNNLKVDLATAKVEFLSSSNEDWKVELIDTGQETMTGGRLHRLESFLRPEGTFFLTYGDGVANVNLTQLLQYHRSHGKLATVTSVRPPARFGNIAFEGNQVKEFLEKPNTGEGWINGGFFVFEPGVFDYLEDGDKTVLEGAPLERLARENQLMGFRHDGFWHCMDTVRDRQHLDAFCAKGKPPWFNLQ